MKRVHQNPQYVSYRRLLDVFLQGRYEFNVNGVKSNTHSFCDKKGVLYSMDESHRVIVVQTAMFYIDTIDLCITTTISGLIACKRLGVPKDIRKLIAKLVRKEEAHVGYLRKAAMKSKRVKMEHLAE